MKKILLTITFMLLIFIPGVKAEGNMKVIFNTSFEEQIDINKIEDIYVMMDDINEKDYNLVLKHKDNFHLELNNIPAGDVIINSINVSRDYTVEYDYETTITKNSEEETVVSILVKKVIKDPNRKKANITNEYIAEVLGYDPLGITTNGTNTPDTTTISNNNPTTGSQTNPDDPVVITSSSSTDHTSTMSENEIKEIEKKKQEEEKQQEQSKRKSIYLMILLVVIAAIIIIGILVGIKIANANK